MKTPAFESLAERVSQLQFGPTPEDVQYQRSVTRVFLYLAGIATISAVGVLGFSLWDGIVLALSSFLPSL